MIGTAAGVDWISRHFAREERDSILDDARCACATSAYVTSLTFCESRSRQPIAFIHSIVFVGVCLSSRSGAARCAIITKSTKLTFCFDVSSVRHVTSARSLARRGLGLGQLVWRQFRSVSVDYFGFGLGTKWSGSVILYRYQFSATVCVTKCQKVLT